MSSGMKPMNAASPPRDGTDPTISPEEFREGFGEDIQAALDVDTWHTGEDLGAIYARVESEVRDAVHQEKEFRSIIRRVVFPRLHDYQGAPHGAGVFHADRAVLERIGRPSLWWSAWFSARRASRCRGESRAENDLVPSRALSASAVCSRSVGITATCVSSSTS